MPGGFAGVDVFFVISGFLMTGIIMKGLETNTFSLLRFYLARANRIIPPLLVLCTVLLLLGWFYLSPIEYRSLGKHAAASLSFLSNVIYLTESGYFDATSHEKWLLHTWSLSVEWQFYIVYPIILVLLRRFISLNAIKGILLATTAIGFLYSVNMTLNSPSSAYYLFFTRAWEMTLGGLAYLYPFTLSTSKKRWLEYTGITLVIGSYVLFSSETAWPGYAALFPVLGTFFIIQAQRSNSVFTGNPVFQKIGTWSYSIYLWHWPLVVVAYKLEIQSWPILLLGVLSSVALGFLSWKWVETIRFQKANSWTAIFKLKYIYATALVAVLSALVYVQNGLNSRFEGFSGGLKSPMRHCAVELGNYEEPAKACEYYDGEVTWAVLGDSHSIELSYSLANALKEQDIALKQFSYQGCFPDFDTESKQLCTQWYQNAVKHIIEDTRIKHVVISHRLSSILGLHIGSANKTLSKKGLLSLATLDNTVKELAKHKQQVFIVSPIPEISTTVGALMTRRLLQHKLSSSIEGQSTEQYLTQNKLIFDHINSTQYPNNVTWVDVKDTYCDESHCYAIREGRILYFDADHPSTLATDLVSKKIINSKNTAAAN